MVAFVLILRGMIITVHAKQVSDMKVTTEVFKDVSVTNFRFVNMHVI